MSDTSKTIRISGLRHDQLRTYADSVGQSMAFVLERMIANLRLPAIGESISGRSLISNGWSISATLCGRVSIVPPGISDASVAAHEAVRLWIFALEFLAERSDALDPTRGGPARLTPVQGAAIEVRPERNGFVVIVGDDANAARTPIRRAAILDLARALRAALEERK